MEVTIDNKVIEFVANFKKPEVINKVRQQALDALNGMDFPTTRVEEWKYTRVAKYTKRKYSQKQITSDISAHTIPELEAHQIVFVNGFYDEKASLLLKDEAIEIKNIEQLDEEYYTDLLEETEENVFSLINKAYQTGGIFIRIKKNQKATYPIHILHFLEGEEVIANSRNFVLAEAGSKAEILVTFQSKNSEDSFTNAVFEGHIEENAHLTIHKLQKEDKNVLHISRELFVQEAFSNFKINTFTTGGILTRNQLDILVEGENNYTELNGAYWGIDKQHIDNHTFVDQLYSHCETNELYKGVLDDRAVGVFNGMILVRSDIEKINAYQSNKNILLSEKAIINSKPELEIYSDDVKCSHGSTIGALDQEAIFYLQARGISKKNAEKMLIAAFIEEVLEKVENPVIRKEAHLLFFDDNDENIEINQL